MKLKEQARTAGGETPEGQAKSIQEPHPKAKQRAWLAIGFVLLLLLIDQAIKLAVKTNMMLGESIKVTDWFYIYFTENPGMAFGWEFFDKAFLTIFRLLASVAIAWLISKVVRQKRFSTGFLLCLSAILSGAIGNIIDSLFYGKIFSHSYRQVATLFPPEGGYAGWLHGKVVDMFYFPIIETTWPEWMPFWGGEEFIFFQPIFNFADACISVGVILLLICYRHSFAQLMGGDHPHSAPTTTPHA